MQLRTLLHSDTRITDQSGFKLTADNEPMCDEPIPYLLTRLTGRLAPYRIQQPLAKNCSANCCLSKFFREEIHPQHAKTGSAFCDAICPPIT
jgi:hypothetical protein